MRGCGSRPRTWAPSCAATARRSRASPGDSRRWRSGSTSTTGSSASTAAASRRCSSTPSCRAERDRLLNAEVATARAEAELAEVEARRDELAAGLSAARADVAAPRLAAAVEAELAALALADASFSIELQQRDEVGPSGAERVEMTLAPNPGVPAAPLREAASGGELSRVMLALMDRRRR